MSCCRLVSGVNSDRKIFFSLTWQLVVLLGIFPRLQRYCQPIHWWPESVILPSLLSPCSDVLQNTLASKVFWTSPPSVAPVSPALSFVFTNSCSLPLRAYCLVDMCIFAACVHWSYFGVTIWIGENGLWGNNNALQLFFLHALGWC